MTIEGKGILSNLGQGDYGGVPLTIRGGICPDLPAEYWQSLRQMVGADQALALGITLIGLLAKEKPMFSTLKPISIGVSLHTVRYWEEGKRQPSGASKALLTVVAKRPDVLLEVMKETSVPSMITE